MRTMPEAFHHIPDHFKTQKMCDKAFEEDFFSLKFVPDWFVRPQQVNLWYDDYYDYGGLWDDDDEAPGWYEGYQKRKSQKSKNKRRTIWYAEIKNTLIKEDVEIWSKTVYN